MRKIGLIGAVCKKGESTSGQVVRTGILYEALVNRYGNKSIVCVNTFNFRCNLLKTCLQMVKCLFTCDRVIIMLSQNGKRIFFPILYLWKKLFNLRVYHNAIGGNLDGVLANDQKQLKYTKAFDMNWVQMDEQAEALKKLGIINVESLPNAKDIEILDAPTMYEDKNHFTFCTFSRVSVAKGIETAMEAITAINKKYGRKIVSLDIYGKPDDDYKDYFEKLMQSAPSYIRYGGIVNYDESKDILHTYFMMLFPTVFDGEGFPGTVLDAYAAGLPVIATDWRYNGTLIRDGINGLIYSYKEPSLLQKKIEWAIGHIDDINAMRQNCLNESHKYTPEKVMSIIFRQLDKKD